MGDVNSKDKPMNSKIVPEHKIKALTEESVTENRSWAHVSELNC